MKQLKLSNFLTMIRQRLGLFVLVFVLVSLSFLTVFSFIGQKQQQTHPQIAQRLYVSHADLTVIPIYLYRMEYDPDKPIVSSSIFSYGNEFIGNDYNTNQFLSQLSSKDYIVEGQEPVAERALENLLKKVSIQFKRESYKVIITVSSPSKRLSEDLLMLIAESYGERLREFSNILNEGMRENSRNDYSGMIWFSEGRVLLVDYAENKEPDYNEIVNVEELALLNYQMIIVSLAIAFIVAFLVVAIRYFSNDKIYNIDDFDGFSIPLLGWTSLVKSEKHTTAIQNKGQYPSSGEFFNQEEFVPIASNVKFHSTEASDKIIGIISPSNNEGKSEFSQQLAQYIRQTGKRVLLIYADGQERVDSIQLKDALQLIENQSLGEDTLENPEITQLLQIKLEEEDYKELYDQNRAKQILKLLLEVYEFVIVDYPSYIESAEKAWVLLHFVDTHVVLARAGLSSKILLKRMISDLTVQNKGITGMVFNGVIPELTTRDSEIFKTWKERHGQNFHKKNIKCWFITIRSYRKYF